MYHIFKITNEWGIEYFFVKGTTWSSNFDSLQQLCDVGVDDTAKVTNPQLKNYTPQELADEISEDTNCKFLCSIQNLETLEEIHPEFFL